MPSCCSANGIECQRRLSLGRLPPLLPSSALGSIPGRGAEPSARKARFTGILGAYRFLTDEHLEAAQVYSGVHPRRGRPTKASAAPPSWKIKSSRHVARHDTKA
jgi:hypothetical protein